jgi:hypothetical protein
MNKVQSTYKFFLYLNEDGMPELTGDFYGESNFKVVVDVRQKKIKSVTFDKEKAMVENLKTFVGNFKGVDFPPRG